MMKLARAALLGAALLVPGAIAQAQQYNTAAGGVVVGTVPLCLDSSNKAVKCDSTNPLTVAATITPSGTQHVDGTGSAGTAAAGVVTVQGITSMVALKVDGSAVTQPVSAASLPLPTGAATSAKQPALGTAGTPSADVISVQGAASMTPLVVTLSSQYPSGATPLTASNTGTTGATTATLGGTSGKTTYICGFTITSDATAALAGNATVTGTISGTLTFIQNVGSATAAGLLTQSFGPCIPASASNTGIAVNSVAAGTGGSTAVVAWGYQL